MPRPRRFRRILKDPPIRCFKPENEDTDALNPIEINIDEFEAIRLRDYLDIQQKKSAELMGISQPTFHRILISARKKISQAIIEGKRIVIVGEDYLTDDNMCICKSCGFEWISHKNEYDKCPECNSSAINIELEKSDTPGEDVSLLKRKSYGGPGLGSGPPRVCKCSECGYEVPKERGVPCRNIKCPKCQTPLCGVN
ncbi:MAG: DUF134 domain-containing protein [Methanothermobacter sp.]